jgi:hypothetical protein
MPEFDYDSLATCLDDHWLRDEAGVIAKVTAFLWQVRLDFDTLGAAHQDERNRAEATRRIGLLVRLWNDPDTIPEALVKRRRILDAAGNEVGLSDLHGQLRQFAEDLGTAALASPDQVKKFDLILHGPRKAGQPKRHDKERIEIVAEVLKLLPNMRPSKAYEKVAADLGKKKNFTADAVRHIVESMIGEMDIKDLCKEGLDVRKDIPENLRADISRARLIAFGKFEF